MGSFLLFPDARRSIRSLSTPAVSTSVKYVLPIRPMLSRRSRVVPGAEETIAPVFVLFACPILPCNDSMGWMNG